MSVRGLDRAGAPRFPSRSGRYRPRGARHAWRGRGAGNRSVSPPDKLGRYRDKRSFGRTPEPAGEVAPEPSGSRRFVVQRHRARRLHYDLRLRDRRRAGQLGGAARARRWTRRSRRMAVHVEDHPLEYADFEGVIPRRRVRRRRRHRLGPRHLGAARHRRPGGSRRRPASCTPSCTARSCAAGSCSSAATRSDARRRQGAVAAAAQARRPRRRGLGPRGPPAVGAQRPHQRRGRGRPRPAAGTPTGRRPRRPSGCAWPDVTRRRAATPSTRSATGGTLGGLRPRAEGHQPRQGAVPGPRPERQPVTKRELLRYTAEVAPTALPYLAGRALNMHRYPDGADTAGLLAQGPAQARARLGDRLGQPDGRQGRDRDLRRRRRAGRAALGRELRRARVARLDLAHRPARPADVRAARHRPRHRPPPGTTCSCSPGCTAPRSSTSGCARSRR